MGILLTKLWRLLWSSREHKVVIVGLDNAGKTTILYRLAFSLNGEVVQASPTIGSNVEEVAWKNIRFIMWDIGGQENLRASWASYYSHTEFLILVVDSTDRRRLSMVKEQLAKMLIHEDLSKASLLVYANKQDVEGAMKAAEVSTELNLTAVKTHKWQIQSCCALTGEGINEGLEWMISNVH